MTTFRFKVKRTLLCPNLWTDKQQPRYGNIDIGQIIRQDKCETRPNK